jgi:ankyrin repeat protein
VAALPPPRFPVVLQDGQTPLHEAAWYGHTAVVGQLLCAGAAVEAATKVPHPPRQWVMGAAESRDMHSCCHHDGSDGRREGAGGVRRGFKADYRRT